MCAPQCTIGYIASFFFHLVHCSFIFTYLAPYRCVKVREPCLVLICIYVFKVQSIFIPSVNHLD